MVRRAGTSERPTSVAVRPYRRKTGERASSAAPSTATPSLAKRRPTSQVSGTASAANNTIGSRREVMWTPKRAKLTQTGSAISGEWPLSVITPS